MLSGFELYPRWVPLIHVTTFLPPKNKYDNMSYQQRFTPGVLLRKLMVYCMV